MFRLSSIVSFFLLVFLVPSALAVDPSRIWLPKKYNQVKPKLLAAARDAEQTERCLEVVAGEMIVRKNTEEHYYFVVTCRDASFKTYNLGYLYPVSGGQPELLTEQKSRAEQAKEQEVEIGDEGVGKEQALQLCQNEMVKLEDEMDDIQVLENEISPPAWRYGQYHYQIPFTTQSRLGAAIRHRADCLVSKEGEASLEASLEAVGALSICRDSVRAEAIIYGRISIDEENIARVNSDAEGFYFYLPFQSKSRIGSVIRYAAECEVDAEGESEVHHYLLMPGALAVCKDALLTETLLMKEVEVAEEASSSESQRTETGERFALTIPFSAHDPDGNRRNFNASCLVDEEGEPEVVTAIDRDSILGVCIGAVKRETEKMLGVEVLEQQPPLQRDGEEGYLALIDFNARNPGGRELHYRAECRVGGNGRTAIALKPRRR